MEFHFGKSVWTLYLWPHINKGFYSSNPVIHDKSNHVPTNPHKQRLVVPVPQSQSTESSYWREDSFSFEFFNIPYLTQSFFYPSILNSSHWCHMDTWPRLIHNELRNLYNITLLYMIFFTFSLNFESRFLSFICF